MVSHLTEFKLLYQFNVDDFFVNCWNTFISSAERSSCILRGFMSVPELPLVIICRALQKFQECQSLGDRIRDQPS
jgi:hypothetical protein